MIIAANHLLKALQGATFDYRFQYINGTNSSQPPFDLTGWQANWQVLSTDRTTMYKNYLSGGDYTQDTSGVYIGGIDNDPTTGLIDMVFDASDTMTFLWTSAYYTLIINKDDVFVPLLSGFITLQPYSQLNVGAVYPDDDVSPSPTLFMIDVSG